MSRTVRFFVAAVIAAMSVASCAKQPADDFSEKQMAAFDAWMTVNGDGAEKQASGIYYKSLDTPAEVVKHPVDGDWVLINYTGRVLFSDDVFISRDSAEAQKQGTFQYYTNYAPEMVQFKPGGQTITQGMYEGLKLMGEGDSARIYVPYTLAYGSSGKSFSYGYQGQVSAIGANTPIIWDIRLEKVISDPVAYENNLVSSYAYDNWGLTVADTLKKNMYRRTLSLGKDTATVREDSTVHVYYVGRFLNGFVFDTNIADTAIRHHIYKTNSGTKYDSMTLLLSGSDTTLSRGFYDALIGMKYGETAQAVFTSAYGYGSAGESSSTTATVIMPYSPLIFTIEVLPPNGDGTSRHPYTVKGVKLLTEDEDDVWVTGYVVGAVEGDDVETQAKYSDTITVKTNILIADQRTANTAEKVIAVQLPEGPIRDALNMVDNAKTLYRKKIAVYGNLRKYLGQRGLVDVTQYSKK